MLRHSIAEFFVDVSTVMPSKAIFSSTYSLPAASQAAFSSSLILRDASEMSVSPAQNFLKPSPVPGPSTVTARSPPLISSASSLTSTAIGSTVDVGFGTGLAVEAKSFTDSYYDTGQPSDYASDLVVYENGTPVARQTVRVNEPLRQGDVTFYQSFFGPAMVVEVADASGTRLFGQGVPLRWSSNDGTERVGFFTLPDRDLTLYVYGVQSGERSAEIRAGQARVEVYRGDAQTFVEGRVVDQGVAATVGGLTVTFVREQQFTGLIAAKDPGVPFVWGGALALLLGVGVVFFFHNRRIWAVIHPAGSGSAVRIAAVVRHDLVER